MKGDDRILCSARPHQGGRDDAAEAQPQAAALRLEGDAAAALVLGTMVRAYLRRTRVAADRPGGVARDRLIRPKVCRCGRDRGISRDGGDNEPV